MASLEAEDPYPESGSSSDWKLLDQTIFDVLGSRGSKRSRNGNDVESCESPSLSASSSRERSAEGEDNAGQSLAPALAAKRKKTGEEEGKGGREDSRKVKLARDLLFSCAACGLEAEEYEEVEKHIQEDHQVGDDQELVLASIRLPNNQEALKSFQCGVKACGMKFVGLKEADLKNHIKTVHGEYYIDVCKGRNIIRICRVCSGKFSSDEELTHHIRAWHHKKLFANGEKNKTEDPLPLPPSLFRSVPEVNRNVITRPEEVEKPRVREAFMDIEKRERKLSESVKDRLSLAVEKKMTEEGESFKVKAQDLKYKLRKFREKYCEACELWTPDWAKHQLSPDHLRNDKKKIRCLFCPKRLCYSNLKFHLSEKHPGNSFTCRVTPYCSVSLVGVSRMVEHINSHHRKNVSSLIQSYGAYWESNLSQLSRDLNSLMKLPSDLRGMTCRKCDLSFLGQDQSALEEHFRQLHPDLNSTQYAENIVYSCRVCLGVVFGSEKHLLHHIQESHQQPAPSRVSEEVHGRRILKDKAQRSKFAGDPDQEDLQQYREAISKIMNKKKFGKTGKMNTFKTKKAQLHDVNHPDDEKEEAAGKKLAEEVICHFCDARMFQSQLSSHLQRRHQAEMFSCDGSCGREVFSPWQERVLHHLRRDHCLAARTDQDLLEQHLRLPASLEMIRCRGGTCEKEATFLGRHLNTLEEKSLVKHSQKKHGGKSIRDSFLLGCRVCPSVWTVEEVEAWSQHCSQEHRSVQSDQVRLQENLALNNNQMAVETAEEKLFVCRISGCQEEVKTFGNSWSFLDHLEADHGYSEAKLKETGESKGCKVARHLKEVFGQEISLPRMVELTKSVQHDSNLDSRTDGDIGNVERICGLCGQEVGENYALHYKPDHMSNSRENKN